MNTEIKCTFSALKFISGDSEHVCRLCLASTDDEEVSFGDSAKVHNSCIDDTVSFSDMFEVLGVKIEPLLPRVLCVDCANSIINAYLFFKLCQQSSDKWSKVFQRLDENLSQSEQINIHRKTAYIIFNEKENIIFTSRTSVQSKAAAIVKIKNIISGRKSVEKKRPQQVESDDQFTFKTSRRKRHKSFNKDTISDRVTCKQCPKVFGTELQMREHAERVHEPKTIQCEKCAKMFASYKMLHRHEKIHHIAAICHLCFVQFPSKNSLRAHLDKHELKKCEKCSKTFMNKHTHKLHLKICGRTDAKDPKFFCDLCNKGFARKNSLRTHLKTNHGYGSVLTCNWCKKKFDAISRLKMHIVKHTRERNFTCSQCGGKFVTQAALVYHTRLHTGEKPFPCDVCSESFLSASRRLEHKRRKHMEPTKQCIYCNMKFVTSNELKKHTARHTNPSSKLYVPLEPYNKTLEPVDETYIMKFLS